MLRPFLTFTITCLILCLSLRAHFLLPAWAIIWKQSNQKTRIIICRAHLLANISLFLQCIILYSGIILFKKISNWLIKKILVLGYFPKWRGWDQWRDKFCLFGHLSFAGQHLKGHSFNIREWNIDHRRWSKRYLRTRGDQIKKKNSFNVRNLNGRGLFCFPVVDKVAEW